ncbi:hypothetical protein JCM19233_3062 [Vibrio astriarenae]|nr:hypothetical protein JCM19233_3062 [Vibrio sp. C7]
MKSNKANRIIASWTNRKMGLSITIMLKALPCDKNAVFITHAQFEYVHLNQSPLDNV